MGGGEANWKIIQQEYFGFLPTLLRGMITRGLRKNLMRTMHGKGIRRLRVEQRLERIEPDLQAITDYLEECAFLFGDKTHAADASVGAILGAIMATPAPTALSRRVSGDPLLVAYVARCEAAMG